MSDRNEARRCANAWSPALGVLVLTAWQAAGAQEQVAGQPQGWGWLAEVGVYHTDNATRNDVAERDDDVVTLRLGVGGGVSSSRVSANLNTDVRFREYLDDSFSDETRLNLSGAADAILIRDRLSWSVSDNFGQALDDPRRADTPDNRGDINVFTTGPRLTLPLGSLNSISLDATYSDRYYENRERDNEQLSGTLQLNRQLSNASQIGLGVEASRTNFDSELGTDFTRQAAFLNYTAGTTRTRLNISVGANRLVLPEEERTDPLVDLTVSRDVSSRSTLSLAASREFSEAADLFEIIRGQGEFGDDLRLTEDLFIPGEPAENTRVQLDWNTVWTRTSLGLGAGWRREESQLNVRSRDTSSLNATLRRDLNSRLTGSIYTQFDRREFDEDGAEDDTLRAGVRLQQALGARTSLGFGVERYDRSGERFLTDFTETRYQLTLTYSTF